MNKETARSLLDVLDVCSEIVGLTRDVSLGRFKDQRFLYPAVERLFEIAGEALTRARRFDPSLINAFSASRTLIGMRNRIAHDYENIRLDIVWETAVYDLPPLVREIEVVLREHGYFQKPVQD